MALVANDVIGRARRILGEVVKATASPGLSNSLVAAICDSNPA